MLIVETVSKIRRAYFVQKKPIKVICRELRVSRKVVRKLIRTEATEFRYGRTAQPLPKLRPWVGALDGLLRGNESKSGRERLTLIRVFDRGAELSPGDTILDDQAMDDWVRGRASSLWHAIGTCRMGADAHSVVDGNLRVRGVEGLRVADASIMPTCVGAGTNIPAMIIAERRPV